MIDFKSELNKFKPILEIDDVEDTIRNDEIQDVMDLLKQISQDNKIGGRGKE